MQTKINAIFGWTHKDTKTLEALLIKANRQNLLFGHDSIIRELQKRTLKGRMPY